MQESYYLGNGNKATLVDQYIADKYGNEIDWAQQLSGQDAAMYELYQSGALSGSNYMNYLNAAEWGIQNTAIPQEDIRSALFGGIMGNNGEFNESATGDQLTSVLNSLHEAYGSKASDMASLAGIDPQTFTDLVLAMTEYNNALSETEDKEKKMETASEHVSEALKKVNSQVNSAKTTQLNRYKDNAADIAKLQEAFKKGGKDAAKALADINQQYNKLNDKQWALNKFMSGDRKDKNMLKEMAEMTGRDAEQLKNMSKEEAAALGEGWQEGLSDEQNTFLDTVQTAVVDPVNKELAKLENIPIHMNIDGTVDTSGLEPAVAAMVQELMAIIKSIDGVGIQWKSTGPMEGHFEAVLSNIGKAFSGKGGGGGGGGGGGKKSNPVDDLIKNLQRQTDMYDHYLKMLEYEETKYKNRGELTILQNALGHEKNLTTAQITHQMNQIMMMQQQMAQTDMGSDEWYKLVDAIRKTEETSAAAKNRLEDIDRELKDLSNQIHKTRTDLEDVVVEEIEARIKRERDMLAGSVSMEDIILDAIRKRYEKEWELIQEDIQRKRDAMQQEMDMIDERLQKRRDAEDTAERMDKLNEYKQQLAMISMDPTRNKDAAELRKQIAEIEKEIAREVADNEAEVSKKSLQDQIEAYDDYVTDREAALQELLKDANNFTDEVNSVLQLSQEQLFDWLKNNVEEYQNSLEEQQKQMLQSWQDTYDQMKGITRTYWEDVAKVLGSQESFMAFMQESEVYKNSSADMQAQYRYQWQDLYRLYEAAIRPGSAQVHVDNWLSGNGAAAGAAASGGSGGGGGGPSGTPKSNPKPASQPATPKQTVYTSTAKWFAWN